jgi:hypothetical protein
MAHIPDADKQEYDIIFKQNETDGVINIPGLRRGEPAVAVNGPGDVSLYVGTDETSAGNVKIGPVAQDKAFVALKEVYRTQLLVSPYAQSYIDVFEEDLSLSNTGFMDTAFGEFFGGEYITPDIPVVNPTAFIVYVTASKTHQIDISVAYSGSGIFNTINEGDNVVVNTSVTSIQLKFDVVQGKMYGFNWMRV